MLCLTLNHSLLIFFLAFYYDGNNGGFWIGYKGEKKVILDEFGGHTMPPLLFQRVADKYKLWLPIKGGQIPCNIRDLHICSNYLPSGWWSEKTKVNLEAVHRRIVEVHWHYEYKKYRKYESEEGHLEDFTKSAMYKFLEDKRRFEFQPINVIR